MGKMLQIISVVLIVATLGKWGYDSYRFGDGLLIYSKDAKIVTVKEKDPLFGTEIERTTTEPGSWMGLLDIAPPFGAIPLCCVFAAVGVFGFIQQKKENKVQ